MLDFFGILTVIFTAKKSSVYRCKDIFTGSVKFALEHWNCFTFTTEKVRGIAYFAISLSFLRGPLILKMFPWLTLNMFLKNFYLYICPWSCTWFFFRLKTHKHNESNRQIYIALYTPTSNVWKFKLFHMLINTFYY